MQDATFPIRLPNGIIVPVKAEEIRQAIGPKNFDSAIQFCVRGKLAEIGTQLTLDDAADETSSMMTEEGPF